MAVTTQRKKKRSGPWSVIIAPNWPLPDLDILREVDGELGGRLLMDVYNIRLFAETPADLRGALFTPGARADQHHLEAPERILDAADLFSRLVSDPIGIDVTDLARACRSVAEWAEDHSYAITAIAFAEAAAHLLPQDAKMANLAGRACRRAMEWARAELWYERGLGLGRRSGNALEYIDGHLGFGNLLRDFGEHGRALRWINRAGLTAKRAGLRESGAEALHDAYAIAYLRNELGRAADIARRAARVYPVHAARVPYFGADVALLLCRKGLYREALELLQVVQVHLSAPVEQLQLWGLVAYAAGGAQDREVFALSVQYVRDMSGRFAESSAGALAYAAAGAQLLKEWGQADALIAAAAGRARGQALAEDLVARVRRDVASRTPGVKRPRSTDPAIAALRGLVPELAARLARWRGPTWRPRTQ